MKIIALFFTLLFLFSCGGHVEKHYHFKSSVVSTEYGDLGAAISGELGKPSRFSRSIDHGNPYKLEVNFSSEKEAHTPLFIKEVKIHSKGGNTLYSFKGGKFETIWLSFDGSWLSSWGVQDLQLNHNPVVVEFKIGFVVDGQNIEKEFTIDFEPFYHEEHT